MAAEESTNKAYLEFLRIRQAFKRRVAIDGFERSYGSDREYDEEFVGKLLGKLFPDREIEYDGEYISVWDDLDMPDKMKLNGIEFNIKSFWYEIGEDGIILINYNSKKFATDALTKIQEARVNKILTSLGYVFSKDFFKL